jgi:hypothetical protein
VENAGCSGETLGGSDISPLRHDDVYLIDSGYGREAVEA